MPTMPPTLICICPFVIFALLTQSIKLTSPAPDTLPAIPPILVAIPAPESVDIFILIAPSARQFSSTDAPFTSPIMPPMVCLNLSAEALISTLSVARIFSNLP